MTDTPRETILADIRNRLAKATPTNHPLLKLSRYEHGGGRLFIDGESGARELIADFYSEGDREFYSRAFADIEWLLAECDTLRAQLAELKANCPNCGQRLRPLCTHHNPLEGYVCESPAEIRAEQAEAQLAALREEHDAAEARLRAQGWQALESPTLLPVWKCKACGCLWRDNLDDTVSLLNAAQKSCASCELSTMEACEIHWLTAAPPITKESQP